MLRSVYQYGFLTIKLRARRSFMLKKSDYDAMLGADSVQSALRRLEKSQYRGFVAPLLVGEFKFGKVEEQLNKAYEAEIEFIKLNLRNRLAIEFFEELLRPLELRCIASIIKSILVGVEWAKGEGFLPTCGRIDASTCRSLVEGGDLKKALQLINEPLAGKVERILKEGTDPARQSLEVEVTIDKYASMKLAEKLGVLRGRDRWATRLVGVTFDAKNIMLVLRMKKLGFQPEIIEKYLIPIHYNLAEEELKKLVTMPTEKEAIKMLTTGFYANLVSPLISAYGLKEDLSIFEIALRRYHSNECEKIFIQRFFHLSEVLAYLYLKFYEVHDLSSILTGKQLGLPSDRIAYNLTLHQPPYPI